MDKKLFGDLAFRARFIFYMKSIGGHRIHQGQPSSETKIASTKYV